MEKMDSRVQQFLNVYEHENESSKFLGMNFIVFVAMPVNALRAMGVTDKFICDHKQLVEKTMRKWMEPRLKMQQPRQQRETLMEDEPRLQQHAGVTARSKSPDFTYRTPAIPADTVYAAYQAKLGENCCGNSERAKHVTGQSPEARCARPSQRQQQLSPDMRRAMRLRSDVRKDTRQLRSDAKHRGQIHSP